MTKQEWEERYAARLIERAGLTKEQASEVAEAGISARLVEDDFLLDDDAYEISPEECADEEMSCWASNES